jgi:hypothetical protein
VFKLRVFCKGAIINKTKSNCDCDYDYFLNLSPKFIRRQISINHYNYNELSAALIALILSLTANITFLSLPSLEFNKQERNSAFLSAFLLMSDNKGFYPRLRFEVRYSRHFLRRQLL